MRSVIEANDLGIWFNANRRRRMTIRDMVLRRNVPRAQGPVLGAARRLVLGRRG